MLAAFAGAAACAGLAHGGEGEGDGSGTNNPDLLRGSYKEDCGFPGRCAVPRPPLAAVAPPLGEKPVLVLVAPADRLTPQGLPVHPDQTVPDGALTAQPAFLDAPVMVAAPPPDWHPGVDLDWAVSLRGAFVNSSRTGERYEAILAPGFSLTALGLRSETRFVAGAEIAKQGDELTRISSFATGLDYSYALDASTDLSAGADIVVTQPANDDPTLEGGVATAPITLDGTAGFAVERQGGRLDMGLRGAVFRTELTETAYADGAVNPNDDQQVTGLTAGGRVGYRLTPVLTAFVDGEATREAFDAPSRSLLVKQDGTTYLAKAGLTGEWGDVLLAEAAAGIGTRAFDDPALSSAAAGLYDLSLTFQPTRTLKLKGSFGTSLVAAAPTTGAGAVVEYVAASELGYTVNSWVGLRALAGARWASYLGAVGQDTAYYAGAGADVKLSRNLSVSTDYRFTHTEQSEKPAEDAHRVEVGVTVSR